MNLKAVGTAVTIIGVIIASFAGNAIARQSGFGAEGWLMAAFALGTLLLSQGPVLQLRQEVRDLRARLADRGDA
jgi:ABC-type glycerol-3-phosphate transport system permease component